MILAACQTNLSALFRASWTKPELVAWIASLFGRHGRKSGSLNDRDLFSTAPYSPDLSVPSVCYFSPPTSSANFNNRCRKSHQFPFSFSGNRWFVFDRLVSCRLNDGFVLESTEFPVVVDVEVDERVDGVLSISVLKKLSFWRIGFFLDLKLRNFWIWICP